MATCRWAVHKMAGKGVSYGSSTIHFRKANLSKAIFVHSVFQNKNDIAQYLQ